MTIKCRFVFKSLSVWQSRADRNICTCWHIFSFSAGLRKSNSRQELGRRICRSQRGFARLLECSWWYRESPDARTRITKSPALRAPSPRQEIERNANHDWLLWQKMQWRIHGYVYIYYKSWVAWLCDQTSVGIKTLGKCSEVSVERYSRKHSDRFIGHLR